MAEPATTAISLTTHLRSSSLDRDAVVSIAAQIGDRLAVLHAAGRTRGEFTSDDVLLHKENGRLRVTLIGLSNPASAHPDPLAAARAVSAYGALLREMCLSLRNTGAPAPDWDAAIAACLDPDPQRRPSIFAVMQTLALPLSEPTLAVVPPPASPAASAQESSKWGPFQLLQRIGQGAFGEVYRAWDPVLEREVALKLLLPRDLNA